MNRSQWVAMGLLILLLCTSSCSTFVKASNAVSTPVSEVLRHGANVVPSGVPVEQFPPGIQVMLSAAYSTGSWDTRLENPQRFELPLLYLHRERNAANEVDRTLTIDVSGVEGGAEVEFELRSWHVNVATGARHRETLRTRLPDHPCQVDDLCRIQWTLDAENMLSDIYSLCVRDEAGILLWENADHNRPDMAVLDIWEMPIDAYTVRITYATLFPFDHGENYHDYRLAPDAVVDYVEQHFIPIILDTWRTQFDAWGFGPIHPEWDPDEVVEIYITAPPFALFYGTGTYTAYEYLDGTLYPERRLWWYSSNNSFQPYGLLEDGYRVVFAHEFFHMVQWNVLLSSGCSTQRWTNAFIEAQGKFVPSVQYPEIEILTGHLNGRPSLYGTTASYFLKERLNTSYQILEENPNERYHLVLYWRFLYEQFGDMGIIRAALEEMACQYDPEIVNAMDSVMDATLARFDGPFKTYEESLIAFSRVNYALRLEGGRCVTSDLRGCGARYFDPHGIYPDPPLKAVLEYTGDRMTYEDSIPASFGMDFIEVSVDHELSGQFIQVTLRSNGAKLNAEIWELERGLWGRSRALTPRPDSMLEIEDGLFTFNIPHLDLTKDLQFALVITRLDPHEKVDPNGGYTLTLEGALSTCDGDSTLGSR